MKQLRRLKIDLSLNADLCHSLCLSLCLSLPALSLSLSLSLCVYKIYIYIERERERAINKLYISKYGFCTCPFFSDSVFCAANYSHLGTGLFMKQHHEAIHSTRNLKTISCTVCIRAGRTNATISQCLRANLNPLRSIQKILEVFNGTAARNLTAIVRIKKELPNMSVRSKP